MSGGVVANPQSLRRLKSDLGRSRQEINTAVARIRSSLRSTNDWNDQVRTKFEQDLNQALAAFARFDQEASRLEAYLERKAGELDRFLSR